jgi:hypothetical protein
MTKQIINRHTIRSVSDGTRVGGATRAK